MTPPPPALPVVAKALASPPTYGLDGALLGMPLDAWRARHPDADACAAAGRTVTCVAAPLPVGGGYLTRQLTYRFKDQRLVEIAFETSVNGFSDVMAMLDRTYGPPRKTVRDLVKLEDQAVFPHVLITWSNGRSTIQLSDPVSPGVVLSVRYRLDAADPEHPNGLGQAAPS